MSNDQVTTSVIEMEPGWVFVKIADPKPATVQIEFFLRRTIDSWFEARPTFVIDKAEAIVNEGEMLGIHVWFHEAEEPQKKKPFAEAPMGTMSIEVHGQIAEKFPREYVEAVLGDAVKMLHVEKYHHDTLVIINPRRVAVLLDTEAHRGIVLPCELVEKVVEGTMKTNLEKWLSNPPANFYVAHIEGSWFGNTD